MLCLLFVDIVFLIFLYQRWIYKVDPNRVNEFGTSGVSPDAPAELPEDGSAEAVTGADTGADTSADVDTSADGGVKSEEDKKTD